MDMVDMGSGSRSGKVASNTWKERIAYTMWRIEVIELPASKSVIHMDKTRRSRRSSYVPLLAASSIRKIPLVSNTHWCAPGTTALFSHTKNRPNSSIVLLSNRNHGCQNMRLSYLYSAAYCLASLYQNIRAGSDNSSGNCPASTARVVPVVCSAVL